MLYKDRTDAAQKLLPYLKKYRHEDCLFMAIPRGGIPIAYQLAKHYHFPLHVLMAKKIGHPWNPELAIGAVSLEDYIVDKRHLIPQPYIDNAIKQIRESLSARYKKLIGKEMGYPLSNKTIIIVDDGIATGNTIFAAIKLIQKRHPGKIIVASPVAPVETSEKIKKLVDEFICPNQISNFSGVSMYYQDFSEVTDDEAIQLLLELNREKETVQK